MLNDYFYSKEYEETYNRPIEYLLFLQWVKDLVDVTKALNKSNDKWYQEVFYIHLVGLFEVVSKKTSIGANTDSYTLHVKQCVNDIYNVLTDDDYIYLVYCRNSAAHPLQTRYDLYDASGNKIDQPTGRLIRGKEIQLTREQIKISLDETTCLYQNDGSLFDKAMLNKLTPDILRLQEGIYERYLEEAAVLNLSANKAIYETMTKLMSS